MLNPGYYRFNKSNKSEFYFIEKIEQAEDSAVFYIKITDWHSNKFLNFDFTHRQNQFPIRLNNQIYTLIGYNDATTKLQSITEQEFNDQLIINILEQAKNQNSEDVINLYYKRTNQRDALLKWVLSNKRKNV